MGTNFFKNALGTHKQDESFSQLEVKESNVMIPDEDYDATVRESQSLLNLASALQEKPDHLLCSEGMISPINLEKSRQQHQMSLSYDGCITDFGNITR